MLLFEFSLNVHAALKALKAKLYQSINEWLHTVKRCRCRILQVPEFGESEKVWQMGKCEHLKKFTSHYLRPNATPEEASKIGQLAHKVSPKSPQATNAQ